MRIACLADSLTDDLAVDDLGDPDLAAVEHADHRTDELAGLGERHDVAPVVAGLEQLRDLLRVVHCAPQSGFRLAASHEAVEREFEPVARLHEREPHVIGAERAVEIAGRHEQTGFVREPGRDLPAVVGAVGRCAARGRTRRRRRRARDRARASASPHELAALDVAGALHVDVRVVAERGRGRGLHHRRRHEPGVLAGLDEVGDEIGVARVEADAHAGEVRALGDAVHREHTVEPGRKDRRGLGRELGVALVARDDRRPRSRAHVGDAGEVRRRRRSTPTGCRVR